MDGDFVPISRERVQEYSNLLRNVFAKSFYTTEYVDWQYFQNPYGVVQGFDYVVGDRVVAHYACIPLKLGIQQTDILLSLNTVTHPKYQGLGLFTKLASKTYEESSRFSMVVGVANQNSFPGFVKKLGFSLLGNLNLHFGPINRTTSSTNECFYSSEFLKWRLSSPRGGFRRTETSNGILVQRKISKFGPSLNQLVPLDGTNEYSNKPIFFPSHILGFRLDWEAIPHSKFDLSLPNKWKPSPLNLIWKPLNQMQNDPPSRFSFLDFDAY